MDALGIDPLKVRELKAAEDARWERTHPRSLEVWERAKPVMPNGVPMSWLRTSYDHPPLFVDEGTGGSFRDVDGNTYADFNIADMSMFTGYGPEPVVRAVADRAARGTQFLLPNEDAIWVAEELGRRYGLPRWQFTLSATHANTEVIRVARAITGREKALFFDGHYHGHFDETLVELEDGRLVPEEAGLPRDVISRSAVVPFNDPEALGAALTTREIAVVITEPVPTNNVGLLLPRDGFHERLRALTRETGTLLCYDETHTQVVGPGGLTRLWDLHPDLVTVGKSIAAGVPLGAYGMTPEVAEVLERPASRDDEKPLVATGGTLFGNPLSMAAARAAMGEVLTAEAYARSQALGARLADGIEGAIGRVGLPWTAHRFWPRSGYTFAPSMPADAAEAREHLDPPLRHLLRVWLGNRGVWEAIVGAGPTCSVAATEDDVDRYVGAFDELLQALTA
jgi:glutamate-1-semialdehyde 2,1-aminomutase